MDERAPRNEAVEGAFFDAAKRIVDKMPKVPTRREVKTFVDSLPLADDGSRRSEINQEARAELVQLLDGYGLLAPPLSDEQRAVHVEAAKKLIGIGQAQQYLANRRMVNKSLINTLPMGPSIFSRDPIYFDPNHIVSASRFESWQGRGPDGSETVRQRQTGEERSSLEAIYDYATRPDAFPPIGVVVLLEKNGRPFVMTENDHRAAAAKLRNEPIAVDWIRFLEEK